MPKETFLLLTSEMALLVYLYSLLEWIWRAAGAMHQVSLGPLGSCGPGTWKRVEREPKPEGQPYPL